MADSGQWRIFYAGQAIGRHLRCRGGVAGVVKSDTWVYVVRHWTAPSLLQHADFPWVPPEHSRAMRRGTRLAFFHSIASSRGCRAMAVPPTSLPSRRNGAQVPPAPDYAATKLERPLAGAGG